MSTNTAETIDGTAQNKRLKMAVNTFSAWSRIDSARAGCMPATVGR
jgi:hypothetical protein